MALTERMQKTTDVGYWTGQIPLQYLYTFGRAGEIFFRAIKDKGVFTGTHCARCGVTYVPPRIYCEECFDRLEDNYLEVGAKGVVHTFTFLTKNLDGSTKEKPEILAMVNLEGTDGGVVHLLGECELQDVDFGLEVEAVLKSQEEREGSIHDILYFKPC